MTLVAAKLRCGTRDDACSREAEMRYMLGVPDCQDKQILGPSVKAKSRSPSPETFQWNSGLDAALEQLVSESTQQLRKRYTSEPPSAASSPPIPDRRYQEVRQSSSAESHVYQEGYGSMEISSKTGFGASTRFSRSLSRSSEDGPSIMSNPRSQSFSEYSRSGRHHQELSSSSVTASVDDIGSDRKYLSARAVAEKLAKAIRGTSFKSSKDNNNKQRPPTIPLPSPSSSATSSPAASSSLSSISSASSSASTAKEVLKRQMENHNGEMSFVYQSLEERVYSAKERLRVIEKESSNWSGDASVRRVRKLMKEKKELASELVNEIGLRSMERMRVRDGMELMKREIYTWMQCVEREKNEIQKKREEDKFSLERQLAFVSSQETTLRHKIREFELQMQSHIERVEDAEKTIVDLRHQLCAKESQSQSYQSRHPRDEQAQRFKFEIDTLQEHVTLLSRMLNAKKLEVPSSVTNTLNNQNTRIQHLTTLCDSYYRKLVELTDCKGEAEDKLKYAEEQLEAERLHCRKKEMELRECREEMKVMNDCRDQMMEVQNVAENANRRVMQLEREVRERENEVEKCRLEIGRIIKQRDDMKQEAEQLGREALRMSAEAEILRRRVHELEEDILMKEGQLSILQASMDDE